VVGGLDGVDAACIRQLEKVDENVSDLVSQVLLFFCGQFFVVLVLLEEFQVLRGFHAESCGLVLGGVELSPVALADERFGFHL